MDRAANRAEVSKAERHSYGFDQSPAPQLRPDEHLLEGVRWAPRGLHSRANDQSETGAPNAKLSFSAKAKAGRIFVLA